ncbi:hypothetical protein TcWFU_001544 [Taenia crassiceps]|uniref:Uncharacterized protein n=1 Tax=Taenia crassiceps TaxID=6207 RepID=A0ABR4QAF4_9CEST
MTSNATPVVLHSILFTPNSASSASWVDVYALVCFLLNIYKPNVVDSDVYRVAPFIKHLPSMDVLRQFDRYAKRLDPLSGASTMLTGNVFLMLALVLALHLIPFHLSARKKLYIFVFK